jgi:hypothetical protein
MADVLPASSALLAPAAVTVRAGAHRAVQPHGFLLHSDRVTDLGRLASGACTHDAR